MRQKYTDDVLHLSGWSTKQCMTLTYCANAEGVVLLLLYVNLCQVQREALIFITQQKDEYNPNAFKLT